MTPLFLPPEAVVPFVARICDERPDYGECRAMGVFDRRGQMVAGVVFHNWNPRSQVIEVSAAATDPRWATRGVLQVAFGYVFGIAQMCVARTHEDNNPVRKLWKAFGAEEIILPRMRGRTASEALLTLTDDAWARSKLSKVRA